jgi:hypothetical protein
MQLLSRLTKQLVVRVVGLSVLSALPLSGCVPGEYPRHHHDDDGEDDGPPYDDPCLNDIMFKVEGDVFTPLSGGAQTLDHRGFLVTESGFGWNPDIEPRAKSHMTIDGYEGKAELFWNDKVVGTFAIDPAFALSDQTGVVSYVDPDGTRVEYHIFARPLCASFPSGPVSRARLAELEK